MSERERFEETIKFHFRSCDFERYEAGNMPQYATAGHYKNIYVQMAWEAWQARADLAAERERELVEAAKAMRNDLLARAETTDGGVAVVACGQGVWAQFNDALDAYEHNEGES